MTTHLVWFSYALDAAPLLQSVRCALQTMPVGTQLHVFDQGTRPLDAATVEALQAYGVRYVVTWFERNGNLNGTSSVLGEIACFIATGAKQGDVVWKLDCDTLILRPECMLKGFLRDPNLLGSGIEMPNHGPGWWGPSYAFRQDVLQTMLEYFQEMPAVDLLYPEDVAMSTWLISASPLRTRTLTTSRQGGSYAYYRWGTGCTLAEYAQRFSIITFGARYLMPSFNPIQQRLRQAAYMQLMLDQFLK